jgi:hypothetical protein
MAARLLLHLTAERTSSGLPPEAARLLTSAQASVRPSHPELPGVYLATVPDATPLEPLIAALARCEGVRHVERDQFRSTP